MRSGWGRRCCLDSRNFRNWRACHCHPARITKPFEKIAEKYIFDGRFFVVTAHVFRTLPHFNRKPTVTWTGVYKALGLACGVCKLSGRKDQLLDLFPIFKIYE